MVLFEDSLMGYVLRIYVPGNQDFSQLLYSICPKELSRNQLGSFDLIHWNILFAYVILLFNIYIYLLLQLILSPTNILENGKKANNFLKKGKRKEKPNNKKYP